MRREENMKNGSREGRRKWRKKQDPNDQAQDKAGAPNATIIKEGIERNHNTMLVMFETRKKCRNDEKKNNEKEARRNEEESEF